MLSIVIPALNEDAAITQVINNIQTAMSDGWTEEYEIIVVDDGSTDRTGEFAAAAGARVVTNLVNIGYGFALKQGIRAAKFDTILITDADGTYPVEKIPELVAHYRRGYNLVVGQRTGPHYHESMIKSPLRTIFKWLVEFTVGRPVLDVNSGFRVFSRKEIIPIFPHLSNKFSFTTSQTLAYMLDMKYVLYVPTDYHKRIGKSKVMLFRDSLSAMQMIVSAIMYYNPLKLFVVLCVGTGLFGLSLLTGGLIADVAGSVWMGVGALLVSVILLAMGLLADLTMQCSERFQSKD